MQHLILLGAGHAHVQVLAGLAGAHWAEGLQITLVAPFPRQLYSGMVPGFVAGHYRLEECAIALEPLLQKTPVRWCRASASALDANRRTVTLDDGSVLAYDWLSVNTGAVQDRARLEQTLPGAGEFAVFLRPLEAFAAQWPAIDTRAKERSLRMAVIGGGAAGVELAMAIRHRLPAAALTLITGGAGAGANYPEGVQRRIRQALQQRRITVLADVAQALHAGEVVLGCGATLACDVPLLATGAQAPHWLGASGLALDAQGFVTVDACQRSTSHAHVFAAGDVSTRVDLPLARSGVYAVRSGPALVRNLAAVVQGREPTPHRPPAHTLNLLACGDRQAIASWGRYSAQGAWVWWLKDRIDRAFIRRYSAA